MSKRRRYFQYRVTEVTGSMVGRVEVGDLTFDHWQGRSHLYSIWDLPTMTVTGSYSVQSEGECTEEQYALLGQRVRGVPA